MKAREFQIKDKVMAALEKVKKVIKQGNQVIPEPIEP